MSTERRNQETTQRQAGQASAAARRRMAARQSDRRPWVLAGVVGAAIIVFLFGLAIREMTRPQPGVRMADLGNTHIPAVEADHEPYNSSPPTSGPHIGGIARPGVYSEQIPDEVQVHNLEDGFVMVQYDCADGCPDLVAQLEGLIEPYLARGEHIVLAPYTPIQHPETGASHRIALTAWTRMDAFDDFDEERVTTFIEAYQGIDHHVPGQG